MTGWDVWQRARRAAFNRIARRAAQRMHVFAATPPTLTLSFDDVPRSAATEGLRVLQAHDAQATYFVSGSYCAQADEEGYASVADLQVLAREGHEIACHGYAHLDYQVTRPSDIVQDLDRNAAFFAEAGLPPARSFAYPYGRATPRAKTLCGARFAICRGVFPDLAGRNADLNILPSVALYASSLSAQEIETWFARLTETGGVLSFFSHGVTPMPGPYDCTPEQLDHVLRLARQNGVAVKRMRDVVG